MPDQSCRKCGQYLKIFSKCFNCKEILQEICVMCDEKTLQRFHIC